MIDFFDDIAYDYPFLVVFVALVFCLFAFKYSLLFLIVPLTLAVFTAFVNKKLFVLLIAVFAVAILLSLRKEFVYCRNFDRGIVQDVKLGKSLSLIVKSKHCKVYLFASKRFSNVKIGDYVLYKSHLKSIESIKNKSFVSYLKSISVNRYGFASWIKVVGRSFPMSYLIDLRKRIEQEFYYFLPSQTEYFLDSAILGDGKYKSKIKDMFINTQTAHIMAVSGLHMGFVFGLFYLIFYYLFSCIKLIYTRFNLKVLASIFSFLPTFAYFLITGFHIPALRSFVMTILFVFSLIFSRRKASYNILFLIAAVFLLFNRNVIFNPSFVMSFLMTMFALLIYGFVDYVRLNKVFKGALFMVLMSVAAVPISSFYFSKVSLISVVSNMLVVPLFGFVVVPFAFVAIFAAFLPYSLLKVYVFKLIGLVVGAFLKLVSTLASLAHPINYTMPIALVFLVYSVFIAVFISSKQLLRPNSRCQTL